MDYKDKYLKYKNKYLTLQKGGTFKITVEFCYYEQNEYNRISEPYTDISEAAFYDKYNVRRIKSNFALVNGCNQTLSVGGGVAGAIYRKNRNVFEHINGKIIFNPNRKSEFHDVYDIINEPNQRVTIKETEIYPAGTVYRIDDNSRTENDVACAYHIKGIDLRMKSAKGIEIRFSDLIKSYYKHILIDFLKNKKQEFIHIPPIPGKIFEGTEITENELMKAVIEFIEENPKPSRSFTIILALDGVKYADQISKFEHIEPTEVILTAQLAKLSHGKSAEEPDISTHHKTGHKVNIFLNYPDNSNSKTDIKNLDFYNKFDPLNNKKFALVIDAVEYNLPYQNKITHIINKTTEEKGNIIFDTSEYPYDHEINTIINKHKQIYVDVCFSINTVDVCLKKH
jgi:hypothetical protein